MTEYIINNKSKFQRQLLNWYDENGRKNLPWQVENAYFVWISEIMLQQTQVSKVMDYFAAFIDKFPTLESLAKASVDDVLKMWSGLGYYNRAKNIHKTALYCHQNNSGELPKNIEKLVELSGIGQSTAAAILSLTYNKPHAILDGNVKRVISRVYRIKNEKPAVLNKKLWQVSKQLISKNRAKNFNQGLMDLGSMVCKRSRPNCETCPLKTICQAYKHNQIEQYPQKKSKVKQKEVTLFVLLMQKNDEIFLTKRNKKGIWPQLWFLPLFESQVFIDKLTKDINTKNIKIKHVLTHRILTIVCTVVNSDVQCSTRGIWIKSKKINEIAHPTALIKILNKS